MMGSTLFRSLRVGCIIAFGKEYAKYRHIWNTVSQKSWYQFPLVYDELVESGLICSQQIQQRDFEQVLLQCLARFFPEKPMDILQKGWFSGEDLVAALRLHTAEVLCERPHVQGPVGNECET